MKPFFRFAFLLLGFFVFLFCVKAEHLTVSDKVNIQSVKPYSSLSLYQAYEPVMMRANGFALEADSGSLQYDITIEMTVLPYKDGYAFSSDMENVTGECDGIRLLPNGNHFSSDNPARITLSYDPARIPMGYKAEDIYTYYCDTTSGVHGNDASSAFTWRRLERVSVDTVAHKVTSLTTHFTDFANAVIRIPEMPESKAFVPTAVTDMLDVDPMHGIPMVEAPSANNRATAELNYPIELPAGRLDMQPNVDLYYSSAGGNGILGVGWSLNLPAITLDTRWGVPRYDPVYESEQYMVNGAAVLFRENDGSAVPLPYQDNSFQPRRNGVVNFYARDTENQNRIIRVGTNPTDYWWAVTDRNGITTYYGRTFNPNDPNDRSIDESSVVRTDNGCIAYWAATATVDVHGNYILYANEKKNNTIYVKQIDYTGNVKQSVAPVYRVKFAYMNREDVSSSGRLGVLQMENRLLCHVLVQYHLPDRPQPEYADNLAAYYMQYTEPQEATLYKSRLAEVVKLDSVHDLMLDDVCSLDEITSGEVERNSLTKELLALMESSGDTMLYDQSMNNLRYPYGKNSLPASVTEFTYANAPSAKNLFSSAVLLSGADEMSLSKNYSRSWSVGGTATVGVGIQVFSTILTGGGNYDFRRSTGGNESMLLDLNGDGLTDIVYEEYGQVWYRRQYKQGSQYAFAPAVRVGGLTRLSRDVTNTHSWGLQLSLGANLSYTNPLSTTYTDTYFSDVNADGLPDMIDGDNILINQLVDGNPVFGEFTGVDTQTISVNNSRCGEIILDGEVDEHLECDLEEVLVDSYPLEDFFGPSVDYEITAGEIKENQEAYPEMLYYDGSVIGNDSEKLYEEIDETTSNRPDISTPKYAQMAPSNAPLLIDSGLIYRIENGRVNVYRLEYVCNPLDADPDIETVRVWVAPKSGTITLTDSISLVENTSESRSRSLTADGISYTIQHCRNITPQGDGMHLHAGNYTLLRDGTVAADDYSVHSWSETLTVQKGDILMFRLRSGENNRYDKTVWRHIVSYSGETDVYDSRWGLPLRTVDPAGNEMRYYYDYMGRLSRVLAPQELSHGKFYTVRYEYRLVNNDLVYTPAYDFTHVYKSMYDSLFTQQEVSLYDQLGRNIQKKHYAEVNGDDKWVVDGAEEWDTFGRVIASEIPFVAQRSSYAYEPLDNNRPITRFSYDVQDRLINQYNADGSSKSMDYHFDRDAGNVLRFSSNMTDENGIKTMVLKSPQDWIVQQVAGDSSRTFFQYTPIGELYCATDPDGYSTHYKYNMFGQVKERDHPDAGRTIWQYDLAGNVVSKQTANLLQHNEAVKYKYSYNRLSEVVYPVHPENNVRYVYDNAGRIAGRVDGTGREEFVYDRMGNVAQSLRRVVLPVDGYVYVFKTQFKYDSFGRIRNIVYPDGEVLHYGYTTGGLLKSVAGIKHGQQNIYLWDRVYDEQGRTIVRLAGNGVMTKYSYDSKRQWLNAMHTVLSDGTPVQELSYKYDAVGNILAIDQSAPAWTNPVLGGAYVNDYKYDSQYRLVKSTGTGDFSYYQNASYSPAGRMGSKFTDTPLGRSDLLFGYDSYRYTHQPRTAYDSNVGEMAFFWDAAGNMVQSISCSRNAGRFHEWDEENRLRFVLGVKYAGYYGYDANGERVYKLAGTSAIDQLNAGYTKAQVMFDDAVLYPNPYMVVTRKGYTKHYYAGTERLAASIGRGGFADMVQPVDTELSEPEKLQIKAFSEWYAQYDPFRQKDLLLKAVSTVDIKGEKREELDYHCGAVHLEYIDLLAHRDILLEAVKSNAYINDNEVEQYYYHADHLGSANWITNRNGRPVQYIHYAPYGELVANQFSRDYNERYKFTGKERDAETGYDYFGARYYYSSWGHWLSVDPLSDKYPTISPYAYCMWNPVKYVDPDGKKIVVGSWWGRFLAKLGFETYEARVYKELEELKTIPDPLTGELVLNKAITELENSEITYYIVDGDKNNYKKGNHTIVYDQGNNVREDKEKRPSIVALAHELGHAHNHDEVKEEHVDSKKKSQGEQEKLQKIINEIKSIDYENYVRTAKNLDERSYNYYAH